MSALEKAKSVRHSKIVFPMKRLVIVLICLSILYANAVWALEGCQDHAADIHSPHQAKKAYDHHVAHVPSHHSHSDPSKIHCPNVFAEFLISPPATLISDPGHVSHLQCAGELVKEFVSHTICGGYGDGPPGLVHSKAFPRHLLLSVIRI